MYLYATVSIRFNALPRPLKMTIFFTAFTDYFIKAVG